MKSENKSLLAGVAAGAVAGVIAGILLAPKSGKETRADIAKHMNEIKDKLTKELSKLSEFTKEKYDQIVGKIVDTYEKDKKLTTEEAKKIKEDLKEKYEEVKEASAKKE
jgi:gas vesicle protein